MIFNKKGFTLIEFMLASIFGLILITEIMAVYIDQRQSYKYQQALSEVQNNMRIANNLLMNDIHSAGSAPCLSMNNMSITSVIKNIIPFDLEFAVHGFAKNDMSVFSKKNIVDDSNVLVVESADPEFSILERKMPDLKSVLINRKNSYQSGDWLLITDCHQSEVAQIAKISIRNNESMITFTDPLKTYYEKMAMVSRIHAYLYYVASTDQKTNFGEVIYSLHRKDLFNAKNLQDDFIDGIDNLHLTFTVKESNGTLGKNLTSEDVSMQHAWSDVISVNIKLLTTSISSVYAEPKAYVFDDEKYGGDHQLHKEIDFSVALYGRS